MIYLISVPQGDKKGHWRCGLPDEGTAATTAIMLTHMGEKIYRVNWFIHWLYHGEYYSLAIRLAVKYGREWSDE